MEDDIEMAEPNPQQAADVEDAAAGPAEEDEDEEDLVFEDEGLNTDLDEVDFKHEKLVTFNSMTWVYVDSQKSVCLLQNYIQCLPHKKICLTCFFVTAEDMDNFQSTHVSEHVTGTIFNLRPHSFRCDICHQKLYLFLTSNFCLLCTN